MSLQPDGSSSAATSTPEELSPDERRQLLRLAHESIAAAFHEDKLSLTPPTSRLAQPRGVFTTLYRNRQLRGCVGYTLPVMSLYQAVAETAQAAAFDDNRFPPVTERELPELRVSLSVLSPLKPVAPDDIELGRHGLTVTWEGHRGLLLPQVPVEHRWDRITFLEQTCRKAGLPLDSWKKGALVEAFTAEVFGEEGLH